MLLTSILVVASLIVVAFILIPMLFREIVPTNAVHIIQASGQPVSYGKDMGGGNVYYKWPSWIPKIGVVVSELPLSVFNIDLGNYPGYDSGRVPFVVDVMAFFRIDNPNTAAMRVSSFEQLKEQLGSILESSVRSILAKYDIEDIMSGRSQFGEQFTSEVDEQLKEWGVTTVKNIEFMDIRDADGSKVIYNIMQKKQSLIDRESRIAVAENTKEAEIAEIIAIRESEVQRQAAEQLVGERTAAKNQAVGIATEKANQAVQEEARTTAEKAMAVKQVELVRAAEIAKDVSVVQSEADQKTAVIEAEAKKQVSIVEAEGIRQSTETKAAGDLRATELKAQGTRTEGDAKAAAELASLTAKAEGEKAYQLASVTAQTELAAKIGDNSGYQNYLIRVEQVNASKAIGMEQAKALEKAGIKVIVTSGDVPGGINKLTDLFSPNGGSAFGGALEALAQTDMGKNLLASFGIKEPGVEAIATKADESKS